MNNYDTNSKGISIDITVVYDESAPNFNDNLVKIEGSDLYQYIHYDSLKKHTLDEITQVYNEQEMAFLVATVLCIEEEEDLEDFQAELDILQDYSIDSIASLYYDGLTYKEKLVFLRDQDIKAPITEEFHTMHLAGYSQGEEASVIVHKEEYDSLCSLDYDELKDSIHHIVYDSPIYYAVVVNGEELELELDEYEYDRDKLIINIVEKCPQLDRSKLIEALNPLIPDEPSYD